VLQTLNLKNLYLEILELIVICETQSFY